MISIQTKETFIRYVKYDEHTNERNISNICRVVWEILLWAAVVITCM